MGDLMNVKRTEYELNLAVERFIDTYKGLRKAAKELIAMMEIMNKKRHQELKALSGNSQKTYEFLVQLMDNSGQIGEKCFGIRCVAEKEERKE
jgi:hypothetical protein